VLQIERVSFGPDAYSASTFMAHVLRDRKGLFVAQSEGGRIVGYILIRIGLGWIGAKRGGITSIAVDPAYRRQGVGRALMARAIQHLQEHDAQEADLEVSVTNRSAQGLYESFGFRRSRLLLDYYGENRDGIKMILDMGADRVLATESAQHDAQHDSSGADHEHDA
jgi:ribosomal-protein-alanine N-acetyltransferase